MSSDGGDQELVTDQIASLVKKYLAEGLKKAVPEKKLAVPELKHPGLQAQARHLVDWIGGLQELTASDLPEEASTKIADLQKKMRRRLAVVVGADSDPSVFNLEDTASKLEFIDKDDDFGKLVAETIAKSSGEASRKRKAPAQQPFRKGGYGGAAFVSAGAQPAAFVPFGAPTFPVGGQFGGYQQPYSPQGQFWNQPAGFQFASGQASFGRNQFRYRAGAGNRPQTCFNCNQAGHRAAECTESKPSTSQ